MELRHLRYFIAVAETGSLTVAAEHRLHTAQPSLGRQIRDLEMEIGVKLLVRSARGVELTPAGRAFLDHARLALAQVEAGTSAARRAANPEHNTLSVGFITGCEPRWLPALRHVLRDEAPSIEVAIANRHSPELADDVASGKLDAAFMRPEVNGLDLEYRTLTTEPLLVVVRSDHRLARCDVVQPRDLAGEEYIGLTDKAPLLRSTIEEYFRRSRINPQTSHRVEYISMAISRVASTGGVTLVPDYARNFLTWSVLAKPLAGTAPSIELVLATHKLNRSPALHALLSNIDTMRKCAGSTFRGALLDRHVAERRLATTDQ